MKPKTTIFFSTPAALFLLLVVLLAQAPSVQAAWTEPTAPPPGGNVAAPLNTASVGQTKTGPLSVEGVFTAAGGIQASVGTGDFAIQATSPNVTTPTTKAGVLGRGGSSIAGGSSVGVYGISYGTPGVGSHIGLLGVANANTSNSYGVYGWNQNFSNAYAGYFLGKTEVVGDLTATQFCLSGVCINSWSDVGSGGAGESLFAENPENNTYLSDTGSNLSLGGTSSTDAAFFFNVAANGGNGSLYSPGSITLGEPIGGQANNGICQAGELCEPGNQDCWGQPASCSNNEICSAGSCIPSDTENPQANVTAPANGANLSGTVAITATATDAPPGTINVVRFYRDASVYLGADAVSPYSYDWDTTAVSNGAHTISAVAEDGAGNQGVSSPITVTVTNAGGGDTTPPFNITGLGEIPGSNWGTRAYLLWNTGVDQAPDSGITSYHLWRKQGNNVPCATVEASPDYQTSTSTDFIIEQDGGAPTGRINFVNIGLTPSTTYTYCVKAINGANPQLESVTSTSFTITTDAEDAGGGDDGSSPVMLKVPCCAVPGGARGPKEILENVAVAPQSTTTPSIAGATPLSTLFSIPGAQAKIENPFLIRSVQAAGAFGGNGNIRLTVNDGVVQIGDANGTILELGNGGQDIASTGDINLRPRAAATNGEVRIGSQTNPGKLCLYGGGAADCRSTWSAGGGVVTNIDQVIWNSQAGTPLGSPPQPASFSIAGSATIGTNLTVASTALVVTSGNVGIGTITPGSKLEVNAGTAGSSGLRFTQLNNTSSTVPNPSAKVLSLSATGDIILVPDGGSGGGIVTSADQVIWNSQAGTPLGSPPQPASFNVAGSGTIGTTFTVQSTALVVTSGRVGIGTASPNATYKLDVVGKANATELCIAGDCRTVWPSGGGAGTIDGSGGAGRVAYWQDADTLTSDGSFAWDTANLRLNLSSLILDNSYNTNGLSLASNAVLLGAGGASPNAGQLLFGDNTGWKFHFGSEISSNFVPKITFDDRGRIGINQIAPTATALQANGSVYIEGGNDFVIGGVGFVGDTDGTAESCFGTQCISDWSHLILNTGPTSPFSGQTQGNGYFNIAGDGKIGGKFTVDAGPIELPTSNRTPFRNEIRQGGVFNGYNLSSQYRFGGTNSPIQGLGFFEDDSDNVIAVITEDRKLHLGYDAGTSAGATQLCFYGQANGDAQCVDDLADFGGGGAVANTDQVIWNTQAGTPLGSPPQPATFNISGSGTIGTRLTVATSSLDVIGNAVGIGTAANASARLAVMGGNVGIGTTSPTGILHVQGADDAASTVVLTPGTDTAAPGFPSINFNVTGSIVASSATANATLTSAGVGNHATVSATNNVYAIVDVPASGNTRNFTVWKNNAGVASNRLFEVNEDGDVRFGPSNVSNGAIAGTAELCLGTTGGANGGCISTWADIGGGGGVVSSTDQVIWNTQAGTPLGSPPQPASFNLSGSGTIATGLTVANTALVVTGGNVGIGTATPGVKLDIVGSAGAVRLLSGSDTTATGLQIGRTSADSEWGVAGAATNYSAIATQGDAVFRAQNGDLILSVVEPGASLRIATGASIGADTEKLTISNAGNVGIGQTGPVAKLAVNNNLAGVGGATDAVASYANNTTGAAFYGQQNNIASGFAGFFSGATRVIGNGAGNGLNVARSAFRVEGFGFSGTPGENIGDAIVAYANGANVAIRGEQFGSTVNSYAGVFGGQVFINNTLVPSVPALNVTHTGTASALTVTQQAGSTNGHGVSSQIASTVNCGSNCAAIYGNTNGNGDAQVYAGYFDGKVHIQGNLTLPGNGAAQYRVPKMAYQTITDVPSEGFSNVIFDSMNCTERPNITIYRNTYVDANFWTNEGYGGEISGTAAGYWAEAVTTQTFQLVNAYSGSGSNPLLDFRVSIVCY